jgi:O-succinylbenzoic acid--CoA ligase
MIAPEGAAQMTLVESNDIDAVHAALARALDGGPPVLSLSDDPVLRDGVIERAQPGEPLEYDDIALVVSTSGSTGDPKLALLPVSALLHSARATLDRLGGPGSWLLALPLFHIAGLQVLVRSITGGTQVVRVDPGPWPEAFIASSNRLPPGRRYTALVPMQLGRLLREGPAAAEVLASYDAVLIGGQAPTPQTLDMALDAGIRVVTTYGMSETSGGCVYDGVALDGIDWALAEDGRVRLSGPVLARGYRLRPDLTAAAFADGWFTSQDAGERMADGRLRVIGRVDQIIVTGGEKVDAQRVWLALTSHPAVAEARVFGVDDAEWGQRVVAAVVLTDQSVTSAELRGLVADRLGRVAAPKQVLVLDALPVLPAGKTDVSALRELAQG